MSDTATQAPPAWAKGYSVPHLKEVAAYFNGHEEGYTYGQYGKVGDLAVVEWLEKGQLHWASMDGYAVVVHRPRVRQQVKDFAGHLRASYQPGDVVIKRWAWQTRAGAQALAARLGSLAHEAQEAGGHLWAEVLHEVPGNRWLLSQLPAQLACTRVKAGSELVGVYLLGTADLASLVAAADPAEDCGLVRMVGGLPVDELAQLVGGLDMAAHYSTKQKGSTWTALALQGYGPGSGPHDPTFIAKPGEMSKRWRAENPDKLGWVPGLTTLGAELQNPVRALLAAAGLPTDARTYDRLRLMRLEPGGELTRHADIDDDAGVADGRLMRLHIPLVSNPQVRFEQWLLDGRLQYQVSMVPGELWYLDQRKPHRAVNGGTAPRVHLVGDFYATPLLRQKLLAGQAPEGAWA